MKNSLKKDLLIFELLILMEVQFFLICFIHSLSKLMWSKRFKCIPVIILMHEQLCHIILPQSSGLAVS